MTKKIFLIAGEPSGDVLGASLMKSLKEESAEPLEFLGIGGPLMQEQGLESFIAMREICVMGLWEVVVHLPRLLKLIQSVVEEVERQNPAALITIDLPDFNFQVAKKLKKQGQFRGKTIHYVAPSVWAWRPWRAKKIAGFLDGLLCLLPFEPKYFTKHGLKAQFIGHPLVEKGPVVADGSSFRKKHQISETDKVLGVFFGSRESELKSMAAVLKETVLILKEQNIDLNIVVPTLPHLEYDVLNLVEGWGYPVTVVTDPDLKWNAFAACDLALAVSGTVGLELAYMGIPHVIAYKMHPLSWVLVRLMVKVKHAHLANILFDKDVVPEYLQRHCDSIEIAKGLLKLLKNEKVCSAQIHNFKNLRKLLGADEPQTPSGKAAAFVLKTIGQ